MIDAKLDGQGRSAAWEALVFYFDDTALRPVVKMDWLPADQLVPVDVDPNGAAYYGHGGRR